MSHARRVRRSSWGAGALVALIAASASCETRSLPPSDAGGGAGAEGGAVARDAAHDAANDVEVDGVTRGAGCGKPLPANQPTTIPGTPNGYLQYTVMGTGATLAGPQPQKAGPRTFWVRVPADYDPNRAYRVVYLGQGCGSYNSANTQTYELYKESEGGSEEAIYVAIDIPTDMANVDCYDNNSGAASQEWEAFELFHTVVDASYCVDNNHVFVVGYSTGAWLANMWGCYFAGDGQHPWNGVPGGAADAGAAPRQFAPKYHIRGQAGLSGVEPPNNPPCNGPVAALWSHDLGDNANPYIGDQAALARVLRMNGCEGSPTAPWRPDLGPVGGSCLQYTACPADYPVIFCTTNGEAKTTESQFFIPALRVLFEQLSPQP